MVVDIKEELRHKLSALLMHTDEEHPIECNIKIGEDMAVGLSSLELPTVTRIFQEPKEGIIWLKMEGVEEPVEFDTLELGDLQTIYLNIKEQEEEPNEDYIEERYEILNEIRNGK